MVIDERSYTLDPMQVADYIAASRDSGQALQKKHGARLLGAFTTNTGILNQYVHLWGWNDPKEREDKRRERDADPDWKAYVAGGRGRVLAQQDRLMVPVDFSPMQMTPPAVTGKGVYERRTYTFHPGQLAGYVADFRTVAVPAFKRAGFELIGLFTVDIGTLNQAIIYLRWKGFDERMRLFANTRDDEGFKQLRAANFQRIVQQESHFLIPTEFSPLT